MILENYKEVLGILKKAPEKFGLPARQKQPTLVVVTKTQPAAKIIPLLEIGHRDFGENRVQEVAEKWPALMQKYPDIKLHLIGALQSNKAQHALELCSHIHTLDRPSLLAELTKNAQPHHKIMVQVNTGNEPQKAGISPLDAPAFLALAKKELGEKFCGLMCIPPVDENPAPHFALLKLLACRPIQRFADEKSPKDVKYGTKSTLATINECSVFPAQREGVARDATLAQQNNLNELSMGMSDDYALAAALGATYVRVGSAIFGERKI